MKAVPTITADRILDRARLLRQEVVPGLHNRVVESIYADAAQLTARSANRAGGRASSVRPGPRHRSGRHQPPMGHPLETIYKESRSAKWTMVAALLTLGAGLLVTFFVAQVWRLLAAG
jgi:hypothetical protein